MVSVKTCVCNTKHSQSDKAFDEQRTGRLARFALSEASATRLSRPPVAMPQRSRTGKDTRDRIRQTSSGHRKNAQMVVTTTGETCKMPDKQISPNNLNTPLPYQWPSEKGHPFLGTWRFMQKGNPTNRFSSKTLTVG